MHYLFYICIFSSTKYTYTYTKYKIYKYTYFLYEPFDFISKIYKKIFTINV